MPSRKRKKVPSPVGSETDSENGSDWAESEGRADVEASVSAPANGKLQSVAAPNPSIEAYKQLSDSRCDAFARFHFDTQCRGLLNVLKLLSATASQPSFAEMACCGSLASDSMSQSTAKSPTDSSSSKTSKQSSKKAAKLSELCAAQTSAVCLHCVYWGCALHCAEHCTTRSHPLWFELSQMAVYCRDCGQKHNSPWTDRILDAFCRRQFAPICEVVRVSADVRRAFSPVVDSGALGVRGMVNLGNTCFIAVLLQCFSNVSPLREYFVTGFHTARHLLQALDSDCVERMVYLRKKEMKKGKERRRSRLLLHELADVASAELADECALKSKPLAKTEYSAMSDAYTAYVSDSSLLTQTSSGSSNSSAVISDMTTTTDSRMKSASQIRRDKAKAKTQSKRKSVVTKIMKKKKKKLDGRLALHLGECMACKIGEVMNEVYSGISKHPLNLADFLYHLWRTEHELAHYRLQQDSHELLMKLLHALCHNSGTSGSGGAHVPGGSRAADEKLTAVIVKLLDRVECDCVTYGIVKEESGVWQKLRQRLEHIAVDEFNCPVHTVFEGKFASTISCANCNYESTTQESFLDISLHLRYPQPITEPIVAVTTTTKLPSPMAAAIDSTVTESSLSSSTLAASSSPGSSVSLSLISSVNDTAIIDGSSKKKMTRTSPSPNATTKSGPRLRLKLKKKSSAKGKTQTATTTKSAKSKAMKVKSTAKSKSKAKLKAAKVARKSRQRQKRKWVDCESLSDCFTHFVAAEKLHHFKCPLCTATNTTAKSLRLAELPKCLILHLKRFGEDSSLLSASHLKIDTGVQFPMNELFDVSPFVAGLPPQLSAEEKRRRGLIFELRSFITHSGNLSSGHYKCYLKKADGSAAIWYGFDDDNVGVLTLDDADTSKDAALIRSQAYMLFYEKAS